MNRWILRQCKNLVDPLVTGHTYKRIRRPKALVSWNRKSSSAQIQAYNPPGTDSDKLKEDLQPDLHSTVYATYQPRVFSTQDGPGSPDCIYSEKGPAKKARIRNRFVGKPASWTKTDLLIYALDDIGKGYTYEGSHGKVDLSWVNPRDKRSQRAFRGNPEVTEQELRRVLYFDSPVIESLQQLLALYIVHTSRFVEDFRQWEQTSAAKPHLERNLLSVFSETNLEFLHSKGYDVEDILTWAWILIAKSPERAVMRYIVYSNHVRQNISAGKLPPTFLYIFLLRRRNINVHGLRLLIEHGWDRLLSHKKYHTRGNFNSYSEIENNDKRLYPKITEPSLIVMFIRLLRHARRVWPDAIVSITSMITMHLNGRNALNSASAVLSDKSAARITYVYNRVLSLLAEPASIQPYLSVVYQQKAQFQVIRKMNQFQPALVVSREGYRALVRVQLAHKKTSRERRWAELKAKSWPPWKEDKSGIDLSIGIEHGRSRAGEILLRSKEAGYASLEWDKVAGVYAGWNTDLSPTIQTRALLRRPPSPRAISLSKKGLVGPEFEDSALIWASRIQSTRTLDEAWACFLSYKETKMKPSQIVYFALFKKIVLDQPAAEFRNQNSQNCHDEAVAMPLPGDGPETWPKPSPNEAIYVRAPAPDRHEFASMMIDDQVQPSKRSLAFMISHAKSLSECTGYLKMGSLSPETVESLLNEDSSSDQHLESLVETVDILLFTSIIRFLVQPALNSGKLEEPEFGEFYFPPKGSSFRQAFRLMYHRRPAYLPPWYSFFQAIVDPSVKIDMAFFGYDEVHPNVAKWRLMCDLLSQIEEIGLCVDFEGFRLLCLGLGKALVANQRLSQKSKEIFYSAVVSDSLDRTKKSSRDQNVDSTQSSTESFLLGGLSLLKTHFERLTGSKLDTNNQKIDLEPSDMMPKSLDPEDLFHPVTMLPRVNQMFHTSHLHAFIRVLGVSGDYPGILDLLRWMHYHAPEMETALDQSANSRRLGRRCIVAVGAFMERGLFHLRDLVPPQERDEARWWASEEVFDEALKIVEMHREWGEWPSNEEIEGYCRTGERSK